MKKNILLLFVIAFSVGACNRKFDSDKWQKGYSHETERRYPNKRKKMLKDLFRNHDVIGFSYEEVKDLLGEPFEENEISDSVYMTYHCGRGSVPWYDGHLRKKMLHITLSNDTVRSIDIEEIFFD